MPPGCNTCLPALGGCVHPGVLLSDFLTCFNEITISKIRLDEFWIKKTEGLVTPGPFWLLKRELELSISNRMSPQWNLYDHSFHTKPYLPRGIIYITCPRVLWGFELLLYDLWSSFDEVEILKIQSNAFEEKTVGGGGGGLVAIRSLLTLKKGSSSIDF